MSRKARILICCALVLVAFGAGVFAYAQVSINRENAANAGAGETSYLVDEVGAIANVRQEAGFDRGTEENPFFVLEIAPYDGMASAGYLIGGQEPIDVDALVRDRDACDFPGKTQLYDVTYGVTFNFWETEKPVYFQAQNTNTTTQYGVMERVADGTGTYARVDGATTSYVQQPNGNYTWTPLTVEESLALTAKPADDSEKMQYEKSSEATQLAENVGDTAMLYFEGVTYVTRSAQTLKHKNAFLRESIGLAYDYDADGKRHAVTDEDEIQRRIDDYHVELYTVTPEDLNLNLHLIERADLIIFTCMSESSTNAWDGSGSFNGIYTYVPSGDTLTDGSGKVKDIYKYVPYMREGKFGYQAPNGTYGRKLNVPKATFSTNQLDWEVVKRIYENNTDPTGICPIVADFKIYSQTITDNTKNVSLVKMAMDGNTASVEKNGTQNNLAKLFLLSYQMTNPVLESFYGPVDAVGANAMFSAVPMKDAAGNTILKKDGTALTTGRFEYDKNWPAAKKTGVTEDSRVYWNSQTLLPWGVVAEASKLNSLSDYGNAMAPFEIMVEAGGAFNMTAENDTTRAGFLAFNSDGNKMGQGFDTNDCGINDNQYGHELYDFFESITDAVPSPVTMADCLHYLLRGVGGSSFNTRKYKVLELQPSPDYENVTYFWAPYFATHLKTVNAPEVEQMTTSEFIGKKVDCISEYDVVYIGMNKMSNDLTMNFNQFKKTSDSERNYGANYVYAHTGPKVDMSYGTYRNHPHNYGGALDFKAFYGWLGSTEDNIERYFAFSGNDLTLLAYNNLCDFSAAGYPIIFANEYYSAYTSASDNTVANTVDRNSYIYKLGKGSGAAVNRIYMGAVDAVKLKSLLVTNYKKVEMVFIDMPVIYNSANAEADRYINSTNPDYRTLSYKFTVNAPADTKYKVKLYVDSNTDGVYDPGTEDVGATVFKTNSSGNKTGTTGEVEAGKTYIVERTITNRVGSLCWKLALVPSGGSADKVVASYSAVSAVKAKPTEKKDIKVLQILSSGNASTLFLPTNEEIATNTFKNTYAEKFYDKIKDLHDMNISFERMGEEEILKQINGFVPDGITANPDFLYDNYDMLVLGFNDCYNGVSDSDLLNKIDEFITLGKAVLYTHDASSGIGMNGSHTVWAKNITQRFRAPFGMDRYGAVQYIGGTVVGTVDKPYLTTSTSGGANKLYTNSLTGGNKRELRQGLTNGTIYRTLYQNLNKTWVDNVVSEKVSRVNRGAITEYPYTIAETIPVTTTHPQYYQLNLEEDDIIVWYCLAQTDGDTNPYTANFYSTTPNDVRNNYYIYNKGNITYTGMGHVTDVTDPEIELFVNTFVAAYRAAADPVSVEITNDDVTCDVSGKQYLCVDVDSSDPDEIIGKDIEDDYEVVSAVAPGGTFDKYAISDVVTKKSKRVYFRLIDLNSYGGSTYDVKIIWNDGVETNGITIDGVTDGKMLAVYRESDDSLVDYKNVKYDNDIIYYVDVPITIKSGISGDAVDTTKLDIEVTLKYKIGIREFTVSGTSEVSIMPRGLFNLD